MCNVLFLPTGKDEVEWKGLTWGLSIGCPDNCCCCENEDDEEDDICAWGDWFSTGVFEPLVWTCCSLTTGWCCWNLELYSWVDWSGGGLKVGNDEFGREFGIRCWNCCCCCCGKDIGGCWLGVTNDEGWVNDDEVDDELVNLFAVSLSTFVVGIGFGITTGGLKFEFELDIEFEFDMGWGWVEKWNCLHLVVKRCKNDEMYTKN